DALKVVFSSSLHVAKSMRMASTTRMIARSNFAGYHSLAGSLAEPFAKGSADDSESCGSTMRVSRNPRENSQNPAMLANTRTVDN
ncbi:hypothetical protein LPJ71_011940, partial [Coemansia sp. S17]